VNSGDALVACNKRKIPCPFRLLDDMGCVLVTIPTIPIPQLNLRLFVEKKNQLDATERFIALMTCLTCFGPFCAHHQELETISVLLPPMVCDALVAGCSRSGTEQPAMRSE